MSINFLAMCLAAAVYVHDAGDANEIINEWVDEYAEVYGPRVTFDLGRRFQDWGVRMEEWDYIEIEQLYSEECFL